METFLCFQKLSFTLAVMRQEVGRGPGGLGEGGRGREGREGAHALTHGHFVLEKQLESQRFLGPQG